MKTPMDPEQKFNIGCCVVIGIVVLLIAFSCAFGKESRSSYDLHNSDGSINWNYYNDMQDYFSKHPEKNPAR